MKEFKLIEKYIDKVLKKDVSNSDLIKLYFNIGKILNDNPKLNVYLLEVYLKNKYGLMIGFTKRNFYNMERFYKQYNSFITLDKLKQVSWKNHLVILKQSKKEELIDICIKYNLDKTQLERYIKKGILPTNKNDIFYDEMLDEFKKLKCIVESIKK